MVIRKRKANRIIRRKTDIKINSGNQWKNSSLTRRLKNKWRNHRGIKIKTIIKYETWIN